MPTRKKTVRAGLEPSSTPSKEKSLRDELKEPPAVRDQLMKARIEKFCQVYVIFENARHAAIACGYKAANADQQGWRMLGRVEVRERIAELREQLYGDDTDFAPKLIKKLKSLALSGVNNARATQATEILARHFSVGEKKDGSGQQDSAARGAVFGAVEAALAHIERSGK
jgi:hypothetical protein